MSLTENKKHSMPPPQSSAFSGHQLSLFQTFLCNGEDERQRLSNTVDFWDSVPKYCVSRKQMSTMRSADGYLPKARRNFDYMGSVFAVEIRPARVSDKDGKEKEYYPSLREELVEDALRKIAAEQNHGFYEELPKAQRSGVVFSIYMLRKELALRGHTVSYQQARESLYILSDAGIEILSGDGTSVFRSSILQTLAGVSRTDLQTDAKARWYADFCPLVTESIRALTYRQYDYHAMMHHSSQLGRWLHKRLSHTYLNASPLTPYTFLFSSVRRDSGLLGEEPQSTATNPPKRYQRDRDAIRSLDRVLDELKERKVLMSYEREERKGVRGRILDVKYKVVAHPDFAKQVKAANKRVSDAKRSVAPPPDTRQRGQGGAGKIGSFSSRFR